MAVMNGVDMSVQDKVSEYNAGIQLLASKDQVHVP